MDLVTKPLVSIVTAFYNEERYLDELLSSILNQTYSNIELICVDDGSDDKSAQIVNMYRDAFEEKHMSIKYVFQKNAGQAAATNRALKMISGKYLCWIDGDDFLFEDAIERRVRFLEAHPDYGMVTSDFYMLYENSGLKVRKNDLYGYLSYQTNQFELTIAGESIIENLAHMINVELYRKINPQLEIDECKQGQNYQIILPILYNYKRGYIDIPSGCYRIHEDSHCHRTRNYDEQLKRLDELLVLFEKILLEMGVADTEYYIKNSTIYMERGRLIDCAGN